jgi:hypothetical protein
MPVTATDLHFGSEPDDPTGVRDCGTCSGRAVVNGQLCPDCQTRQQLRNAWWASGPGPAQVRAAIERLS